MQTDSVMQQLSIWSRAKPIKTSDSMHQFFIKQSIISLQIRNQFKHMKKQMPSQEITRIIERENVITFKRKNQQKSSLKSQKEEDEEIESAKSNQNNQDNSFNKVSRRNGPLPELNRQKKRILPRNIIAQPKPQSNSNYLQKQVRQHDNIMLKNANNHLTNQNIRLKTKNMNLEKEILRLQKIIEEDPAKNKINTMKEIKMRGSGDTSSIRAVLKNMQKELEEVKKENAKIKTSVKFTTISELEVERDNILEESIRLREMLEEQRNRLNFLKANQQGLSNMEQRFYQLQEKNNILTKQNGEIKAKLNKIDDKDRTSLKFVQNQKNLNRMLLNARKVLKDKEKQMEILKGELKKSSQKVQSLKVLQTSSGLDSSIKRDVKSDLSNKAQKPNQRLKVNKQKRLMSKSAQKYRSGAPHQKNEECQNCSNLKDQNMFLTKQVQSLKADIEQLKMGKLPVNDLSKNPIKLATKQQIQKVKRFLVHRFKAHHLTQQQAIFHLINYEGKVQDMQTQMSVGQLLQVLMAEPFSMLSDRYIQSFVTVIFYKQLLTTQNKEDTFTIDEKKTMKRKALSQNFKELIGTYQLINQNREEQMFIQIAQLVTQYQQHILKALNQKRNSQNTIKEDDFYIFFHQIQLQTEYIDFMVSQIILESLDLDHLNIYNLFEIFYMPSQEQVGLPSKAEGGKKKYNMIESVVKEQDEEYQQSKSFLQSRQKTLSKHDEQNDHKQVKESDDEFHQNNFLINKAQQQQYDQHFQQQKMQNYQQQQKANQQQLQKPKPPQHYAIQNVEEEYVDDYEA